MDNPQQLAKRLKTNNDIKCFDRPTYDEMVKTILSQLDSCYIIRCTFDTSVVRNIMDDIKRERPMFRGYARLLSDKPCMFMLIGIIKTKFKSVKSHGDYVTLKYKNNELLQLTMLKDDCDLLVEMVKSKNWVSRVFL